MKVTAGRIVLYVLSAKDAEEVNRRRTTGSAISERIKVREWPMGSQAHIGNEAKAGDVLPMIVVKAPGGDSVNGQVLLDGNDVLWVSSVQNSQIPDTGKWHWPPRE